MDCDHLFKSILRTVLILSIFYASTYCTLSLSEDYKKHKCAFFDHRKPLYANCTDIKTCQVYVECRFCFVVYATIKNRTIPQLAGCMGKGHECPKKNTNECVLKHKRRHAHYCCCYGDYCNKNIVIIEENLIPKTTTPGPTLLVTEVPKEEKSNKILYILPPVFGSIIVLAVLQKLWKKHKRAMSHGVPLLPNSPPQTPPLQSKPIQFHEIVSRGQFGYVWKALYDHKSVAVKIIQLHERASWESEKNMYSNFKLRHDNVLLFHAAEKRCHQEVIQYWIITEYHQHGSLADYLSKQVLSFDQLMRLASSMVAGLVYLHCEDLSATPPKPIIAHRDFKSRNVLVKENLTCCISDFGSACAFPKDYKKDEARAQVGTKRYMAPEVLQGAVAFQAEAFLCIDVYALALVLWELLSRFSPNGDPLEQYRAPYEEEVGSHPTIEEMKRVVVVNNIRPIIKEEWRNDERLNEYCAALEDCWDDDGDARLTVHCVFERLSLICKEELYNVKCSKLDAYEGERVELFETKPGVLSSSSGYLSDHTCEGENIC